MDHPRRGRLAIAALAPVGAFLAAAAAFGAEPPVASFSVSPPAPLTLEPVTLTSTSTGQIHSYAWDLDGDGVFDDASGETASRVFSIPGAYSVSLRVEGQEGSGEQTRKVTARNRPPEARLGWFPDGPVAGEAVVLSSSSGDPDGFVTAEEWDLDGDGAFDDGAGPAVVRTFADPGAYPVRLRAVDDHGAVAIAEGTLVVGGRELRLMSPFPIVRLVGTVTRTGTLVRRLAVDAPPGATVEVTCSGRGCGAKRQTRRLAGTAATLRFRRFERRLQPRAALRVYVSRPDAVGKYSRFWFRRNRPPARRDLCLAPGLNRPVRCPTG